MPDQLGNVITWSGAVSAVTWTAAGVIASKTTTSLWHNHWFVACVVVGLVSLAILLLTGPRLLWRWCRDRWPLVVSVSVRKRARQPAQPPGHSGSDEPTGQPAVEQAPPKTGLEIVIDKELATRFPGTGLILEIEYRVINYDPVSHILRRSMFGMGGMPLASAPDYDRLVQEEWSIRQRRERDGFLNRVEPGETVRGVYVNSFGWDPTGDFPDYTLVIKTERGEYRARPHGAGEPVA